MHRRLSLGLGSWFRACSLGRSFFFKRIYLFVHLFFIYLFTCFLSNPRLQRVATVAQSWPIFQRRGPISLGDASDRCYVTESEHIHCAYVQMYMDVDECAFSTKQGRNMANFSRLPAMPINKYPQTSGVFGQNRDGSILHGHGRYIASGSANIARGGDGGAWLLNVGRILQRDGLLDGSRIKCLSGRRKGRRQGTADLIYIGERPSWY